MFCFQTPVYQLSTKKVLKSSVNKGNVNVTFLVDQCNFNIQSLYFI